VGPFQTAAAVCSGVMSVLRSAWLPAAQYLAVPLLLYVGMPDPHLAIGTSAVAVAVNAFANVVPHHIKRDKEWRSR
jgi:uncharacterized protein